MGYGERTVDSQGVARRYLYRIMATFTRGAKSSAGTLEVLVNETDQRIVDILYMSG